MTNRQQILYSGNIYRSIKENSSSKKHLDSIRFDSTELKFKVIQYFNNIKKQNYVYTFKKSDTINNKKLQSIIETSTVV